MGYFTDEEIRLANELGLVNHIETSKTEIDRLMSSNIPDIDKKARKDYRNLTCFAIDSESTTGIDDAFSVLSDGSFMVHIADPTRYFPRGKSDPVFFDAMRRVQSTYVLNGSVSMFPRKISEELLSLDGKYSDGSALTFGFKFSADGGIIHKSCFITPSYIGKPLRMSYNEANNMILSSHRNLRYAYEQALLRRSWRKTVGKALRLEKVNIQDISRAGPSNLIVTELMICTGAVAGQFSSTNGIPVPYRGQRMIKYGSEKTELRIESFRHESLGICEYLQVTSPGRRSVDLISHLQIKACLRGKGPFLTRDAVENEILYIESVTEKIKRFERVFRAARKIRSKAKLHTKSQKNH